MKPVKPLWGFGWAGWCLLAAALMLILALITGVDVRFRLLECITRVFGGRGVLWFVGTFLAAHTMDFPATNFSGIWMPQMRFSLLTMCCVLIGLQVHPRTHGWARISAVALLGLMATPLFSMMLGWIGASRRAPNSATFLASLGGDAMIASSAVGMICALGVGWASRSWRLGMMIAAQCAVGAWLLGESMRSAYKQPQLLIAVNETEWWYQALSWSWNAVVLGCFLVWAVRVRLRTFPAHACQACGYDVRGLAGARCPECGAACSTSQPKSDLAADPGVHSPP